MSSHSFAPGPKGFEPSPEYDANNLNGIMFSGLVLLLGVLPAWPTPQGTFRFGTVWVAPPPPNPFEEELKKRQRSGQKFKWPKPN